MARKTSKAKSLADHLTRTIAPGVKAAFDHEEGPPGVHAHCSAQICGGEGYTCTGSGSHSCKQSFVCNGQKYHGASGENCPGEFHCTAKYIA